MDAKTKKAIRDGVSADKITFKSDGSVVFKSSYFYRHGRSAESFGANVEAALKRAGLRPISLETQDAWAAWPKTSYFIAKVRLEG